MRFNFFVLYLVTMMAFMAGRSFDWKVHLWSSRTRGFLFLSSFIIITSSLHCLMSDTVGHTLNVGAKVV